MASIIANVLKQVQETTITIGHTKGHFISQAQVAAILKANSDTPPDWELEEEIIAGSSEVPLPVEKALEEARSKLQLEISSLQFQITRASGATKGSLNNTLQKKLSDYNRLRHGGS